MRSWGVRCLVVATAIASPCAAGEPPAEAPAIVVSAKGDGDVRTLAEAVTRAPVGGRILVHAGVYRESIELRRAVEIRADGAEAKDVVLEGAKGPAVLVSAPDVIVAGITLRVRKVAGVVPRPAVEVVGVAVAGLVSCLVSSQDGNAITVGGGSTLRLVGCRLEEATADGIAVGAKASVTLERTGITSCRKNGVTIDAGATVIGRDLVVSGCGGETIEVRPGAKLALDVAALKGGGARGVFAAGPDTTVQLANVSIASCRGSGVVAESGAKLQAVDCTLSDLGGIGIHLKQSTGRTILRGCRIQSGALAGMAIAESDASIEACDVGGCRLVGIEVGGRCDVTIRDSKLHEQKEGADFAVHGECTVSAADCEFWGAAKAPEIWVSEKAQVSVTGGSVHDGGAEGAFVTAAGNLNLSGVEVRGNKAAGVRLEAGIALVRGCKITKNGGPAVLAGIVGVGTFEDCDLTGNRGGAWSLHKDALIVRRGNTPPK